MSQLLSNVERFLADVVPKISTDHLFYEDKEDPTSLKQIQQMGEHDEWFAMLFNDGPFCRVAEELLEGPVVPKFMQCFNKPPGGSATPPHQDGFYFMLNPCEAVTTWLALEDADEENGCVRYVPGSHLRPMREHGRTKTLGFSQGIVDYPTPDDLSKEVAMQAAPGDLVVLHAKTIHRADANRSTVRTRKAMGFIYYSEGKRRGSCGLSGESSARNEVTRKAIAATAKTLEQSSNRSRLSLQADPL
ncbi:phytanoyl-CoA dioxygenase family protein [Stieleria marina]